MLLKISLEEAGHKFSFHFLPMTFLVAPHVPRGVSIEQPHLSNIFSLNTGILPKKVFRQIFDTLLYQLHKFKSLEFRQHFLLLNR